MTDSPLKGRLLVATPSLHSDDFERTVVLVLEHNEGGAVGTVLNRPTDVQLASAVPDWVPFAAQPEVMFVGGPVNPEAGICLARALSEEPVPGWSHLFGGLGTLDLERPPAEIAVTVDEVRLFLGYAGWGPGQLEGEIAAGAWFVLDAEPDDALSDHPDDLWRRVLRRQGGRVAAFANFPPDPSLN